MHLWARMLSFPQGQSGDTEATYPNLIMSPKIRQYHGLLLGDSSSMAQAPSKQAHVPLHLDALHPPIAGEAIGG